MKYFKTRDFDDYSKMSPEILCALDAFRELTRHPVFVSPAEGAQWRDDLTNSMHNARPQSKAVDIFPRASMWIAFLAALQVPEIKGIGLYPHWNYYNKNLHYGMHIDVRDSLDKVIWWENKDREYITIHSMNQFQQLIKEYT